MEVAKYIGLFLLKNNSCYIHGLGNIELRRKPASYDGRNLIPASYEVAVVQANTVDDSLSNFIATNEQISISKASNALKEFVDNAKASLQEGKEVLIPSLGNFYETNDKLHFATAAALQHHYAAIPAEKTNLRRVDERRAQPAPQPTYYEQPSQEYVNPLPPVQPTAPAYDYTQPEEKERKKKGIIWWRVILFVLILAGLIGGIGFAVKNMLKQGMSAPSDSTAKTTQLPVSNPDTMSNTIPAQAVDSSLLIDTSVTLAQPPAVNAAPTAQGATSVPMETYKVLLNTYDERARAEKRLRKLKAFGNRVEMVEEDSISFYILMPITAPVSRRARILDSLKSTFNPDGVSVW